MRTTDIPEEVMQFARDATTFLVEKGPIQDGLGDPVSEIRTPGNGPRASIEVAIQEIPVDADPPEARIFNCQVWAHYARGRLRLTGLIGYLPGQVDGWNLELISPDRHPGQSWGIRVFPCEGGGSLIWEEAPLAA
jgi:hypothetical protein